MYHRSTEVLSRLPSVVGHGASAPFVLFEFRKNRTSYSARFPLMYRYGRASVGDRTNSFTRFLLKFEPIMKHPDKTTHS